MTTEARSVGLRAKTSQETDHSANKLRNYTENISSEHSTHTTLSISNEEKWRHVMGENCLS